ncbi:unnamed protein product [Boreogadus saida]
METAVAEVRHFLKQQRTGRSLGPVHVTQGWCLERNDGAEGLGRESVVVQRSACCTRKEQLGPEAQGSPVNMQAFGH